MTTPSGELLRMLSGGVRPCDAGPPEPHEHGALDFGAMMARAWAATLHSDLPVRVPAGLSPQPDAATCDLISRATDRAEAEGIERALVMLPGGSFRVDVRSRAVIDAPDAQLSAVGGIDGVVVESGPESGRAQATPAAGPARLVRNASLIDALAGVRPDDR